MTNPNNCLTCDHHSVQRNLENNGDAEALKDKLHCYMFREAPKDVCMQHSMRDPIRSFRELFKAL